MRTRKDAQYATYDEGVLRRLTEDFELSQSRLSPFACCDSEAVRREPEPFHPARPNFVKDTERILNCWHFNRLADKTQVFALYRNDDITRRLQHVQIVSRIARDMGRMLGLNQDLIEAISLAHDIGHTPFGHLGEQILSYLLLEADGVPFRHNVQGVRVLDHILGYNLSLQTLDGVLTHNGRAVSASCPPDPYAVDDPLSAFASFEERARRALLSTRDDEHVVPATLEACVVRVADILAYLGKDRQDAGVLRMDVGGPFEPNPVLGATNSEFIFNAVEDIVRSSYGKPSLEMSEECAAAIRHEKRVNYEKIYTRQNAGAEKSLRNMFSRLFERCMDDMARRDENSIIFRHHVVRCVRSRPDGAERVERYLEDGPARVTADFIASMTDDYLVDLYAHLFPGRKELAYKSYFGTTEALRAGKEEQVSLVDKLEQGVVLYDGSKGSLLADRLGGKCPEELNLSDPDAVSKLTSAYIEAGSQVVQTNTFGANEPVLKAHGLEGRQDEIIERACEIAFECAKGTDVLVAGDVGPTGLYFAPAGHLDFETAVRIFTDELKIMKRCGIRLVNFETFMDINEMRAAIMAAQEVGDLEVISSMSFQGERTMNGTDAAACAVSCACLGASVIGANCSGGPASLMAPIRQMGRTVPLERVVKPNAGLPHKKDGQTVYDIGPEEFADEMLPFADMGVRLLGGCCGTTPEHIAALKRKLEGRSWQALLQGSLGPIISSPLGTLDMSRSDLTFTEMLFPEIDEDMVEDDFMSVSDVLPVDWESCDACVLDFAHLTLDFSVEKLVTAVTLFLKKPVIIRHGSRDVVELFLRYYPGRCALQEGPWVPERTFGALIVGAGYRPVEGR